MNQELIAYLDRRFGDLDKSLDRRFGEVDTQIRETQISLREHIDTQSRETQIMIEGLRSSQETLAESIVDMNADRARSEERAERKRQKDLAFCTSLFSDVRGRVDDHEDRLGVCEARVKRIESAGR